MKNIIDTITKAGDSLAKDMVKSSFSIDKEAFGDHVEYLLQVSRDTLKSITSSKGVLVSEQTITTLSSKSSVPGIKAYQAYRAKFSSPAKCGSLEKKEPMVCIRIALEQYIEVLEDINARLAVLFPLATINAANVKLSHLIVIATLNEAKELQMYASYMMNALTSGLLDLPVTKYRLMYLEKACPEVVSTISRLYSNKLRIDVQGTITDLKSRTLDFNLIPAKDTIAVNTVSANAFDKYQITAIAVGIAIVTGGFFHLIGEGGVHLSQAKYERAKADKAWIEAQVELLKLKQSGVKQSSPEYQRIQGIIEKYNDMVTKLDMKITKIEDKYK